MALRPCMVQPSSEHRGSVECPTAVPLVLLIITFKLPRECVSVKPSSQDLVAVASSNDWRTEGRRILLKKSGFSSWLVHAMQLPALCSFVLTHFSPRPQLQGKSSQQASKAFWICPQGCLQTFLDCDVRGAVLWPIVII